MSLSDPLGEFEPLADHAPGGPRKAGGPPPRTPGAAIASLVLGLLSLVSFLPFLLGIPAIVLGLRSLRGGHPGEGRHGGLACAGILLGGVGCLLFLALPDFYFPFKQIRRNECLVNLKQIYFAMLQYDSIHDTLPPAYILDASGEPGLSWRVLILPHMGQEELYKRFRLDEPWDSPTNLVLLTQIPSPYVCPSDGGTGPETGNTGYVALWGPGAVYRGAEPTTFDKFGDATDGTLLVVETDRLVPWTKPEDLPFNPSLPDGGLSRAGSHHPGGFNALFADGSLRNLRRRRLSPAHLRALGTASGGEVVPTSSFWP